MALNIGGNSIISVSIPNKSVLYASYMSFVKGGGLFVRSQKKHRLGDEVFLLVELMEEKDKLPITGKVVFISPVNQGNRVQGVGIQFSANDGPKVNDRIVKILSGLLDGNTQPTFTL